LLRLLIEQLERTFTVEGQSRALRVITELLERLDDETLRAYAYQHGIRSEDEFEEAPAMRSRGAWDVSRRSRRATAPSGRGM